MSIELFKKTPQKTITFYNSTIPLVTFGLQMFDLSYFVRVLVAVMMRNLFVMIFDQMQHPKVVPHQSADSMFVVWTHVGMLVRKVVGVGGQMPVMRLMVLVGARFQQHPHNLIKTLVAGDE